MSVLAQEKTTSPYLFLTGPRPVLIGLLFLAAVSTVVVAIFSVVFQTAAVMIAFIVFGLLGLLFAHRAGKYACYLFVFVYCLNALIALAIYLIYLNHYGTPYYYGGSDDLNYEQWAQQVAQQLSVWDYASIRDGIVSKYHNSVGYIYFVSLLYRLGELWGGFHTMLPRLFNGMTLGLMAVLVFIIAKRNQLSRKIAASAALFVGLLPIMTFNAAHTFRDTLVSFLTLWVIFQWDKLLVGVSGQKYYQSWLWTIVIAGLMWELRQPQAAALLILGLLFDLFLVQRIETSGRSRRFLHIIAIGGLAVIGLWRIGLDWVLNWVDSYAQIYTDYRLGVASGLSNIIFSTPLPISIILRVFYGLIVPLPFVGTRFEELYQGTGTLVHLFFLPFLILGFRKPFYSPSKGLWVLSFLLFYSMNLVTFTSRHIVVYLPYAALIVGWGYARHRKYRVPIWLTMLCGGVALTIVYAILKL